MSARRWIVALVSLSLATSALAGCFGSSSSSPQATGSDGLPEAVVPPCAGAELHQRTPYTKCVNGTVANMEDDLWCCPDMTMHTTTALVSQTSQACDAADAGASTSDDGGQVDQTPACGQPGSGCDSTVCGATPDGGRAGTCTKKYGSCVCAVPGGEQMCTLSNTACLDVSCSLAGGACTFYSNGTDSGCYCAK
jgi:hypothetical protein